VFAAWSGEELGLIGSTHYVNQFKPKHPHHPHGDAHAPRHGQAVTKAKSGRTEQVVKKPSSAGAPKTEPHKPPEQVKTGAAGQLSFGWAEASISPKEPVAICGQYHTRISGKIHDPICPNPASAAVDLHRTVTAFR